MPLPPALESTNFLKNPLTDQEFAEIFFVLFINLAGVGIPIIEQSAFRPPPCSFDVGIKEDFPFVFSHHPFTRRGVLHPSFGCYIHKIVCSCPFSRISPSLGGSAPIPSPKRGESTLRAVEPPRTPGHHRFWSMGSSFPVSR
jgi:hypothetical protein